MKFKTLTQLYNHIWETRPHISELSDRPLLHKGHFKWRWQFLHILPHGSYPSYKYKEENIMLGLPEEHEKQETFPKFIERRDELRRQYYKEIFGKEFK